MRALGDEARQPFTGLGVGIRPRDAGSIEAARARLVDESGFDRAGFVQKSRSA
jgi:hypothetical protein